MLSGADWQSEKSYVEVEGLILGNCAKSCDESENVLAAEASLGRQDASKPPSCTQMMDELFVNFLGSCVGRLWKARRPKVKFIQMEGLASSECEICSVSFIRYYHINRSRMSTYVNA